MLPLTQTLQQLEPLWSSLRIPTTILQGKKDWLVDDKNAEFLGKQLGKHAYLRLEIKKELGHFFVFSKPDIVLTHLDNLRDALHQAKMDD